MPSLTKISFCSYLALGIPATYASCLDDVSDFAIKICGEIKDEGITTVVNASGKVDANVNNIISRIVGSGTANVSGSVLRTTYSNVVQQDLSKRIFDELECRQKMVAVAVQQACQAKPHPASLHYSTTCKFTSGTRAGDQQYYAPGTPGLTPAIVGTVCTDGMGSYGYAIDDQ